MSRTVPFLRHSPAVRLSHHITNSIAGRPTGASSSREPRRRGNETQSCTQQKDSVYHGHGRGSAVVSPSRERRQSPSIEHFFISSLVAASTCRQHRVLQEPERYWNHGMHRRPRHTKSYSTASSQQHVLPESDGQSELTKAELNSLVEDYDHSAFPSFKRSGWRRSRKKAELATTANSPHIPLAPRLMLTPQQELAQEQHAAARISEGDESDERHGASNISGASQASDSSGDSDQEKLRLFGRLIRLPRHRIHPHELWRLYQELPSSSSSWFTPGRTRRLLSHFGLVQSWDEPLAQQYFFQLIRDFEARNLPVHKYDYTTAIAFAGRMSRRTTTEQVKFAIETWMRMEDHGHAADHVTFNILFDTAVRAGKFALADTVYKEMLAREMPFDRYFRASQIHYAGVRRDGARVRVAFREAVEAGEIIDTTLMNAVIWSLLRAGEPASAEHVFYNMKRLHEEKLKSKFPRNWREKKELRRLLNKTAHDLRELKKGQESASSDFPIDLEDRREEIQKVSPIEPDSTTYAILIQHHAYTSGNVERVWELLRDMRQNGLGVPTETFVHVLKGFRTHGGYAFSAWSRHRLEDLWITTMGSLEPALAALPHKSPLTINEANDAPPDDIPVDRDSVGSKAKLQDGQHHGAVEEHDSTDLPAGDGTSVETPGSDAIDSSGISTASVLEQASPGNGSRLLTPSPKMESVAYLSKPPSVTSMDIANNEPQKFETYLSVLDAVHSEASSPLQSAALVHAGSSEHSSPPREPEPMQCSTEYRPMTADSSEASPNVTRKNPGTSKCEDVADASFESQPIYRRPFHPSNNDTLHIVSLPPSGQAPDPQGNHTGGESSELAITPELALAAVRAFYQCCGNKRMLQVWDEITMKWSNASEDERTSVSNEVQKLRRHAEVYGGAKG